VSKPVVRCILRTVDVGGHNAIDISPCNDGTERDPAFVDSFDVVPNPGNSIGDARVNSYCSEECSGIRDVGIVGNKEHGKPYTTDQGKGNVEDASTTQSIGSEPNETCLIN